MTTPPTAIPGPWTVHAETYANDAAGSFVIRGRATTGIEYDIAFTAGGFVGTIEADNARLIAAAPAMRALLISLLTADTLTDAGQDDIRALLAYL